MLLSFLFWNLAKKPLTERIASLTAIHDIDVIILAECIDDPQRIADALNRSEHGFYHVPFNPPGSHIVLITRLPKDAVINERDNSIRRLAIRRLRVGPHPGILLAAVHLVSKIIMEPDDQMEQAKEVIRDIIDVEEKSNNFRTILVGDFNMNPFERGMAGVPAFHGVMTRGQAKKRSRKVQGNSHRYFYNPMWGIFGDRTDGPPGTHYFRGSRYLEYFWNMYDQVLLRPELMKNLKSVRVLDSDGLSSFMTARGIPDKSNLSDHLPIFFQLNL